MEYLLDLIVFGTELVPPVVLFIIALIKYFKFNKEKALIKPNVTDYELYWAQNLPEIVEIGAKLNIYNIIMKTTLWVSGIISLLSLLSAILSASGVFNSFVAMTMSLTSLSIMCCVTFFCMFKKYREKLNEKNKFIEELVAESKMTQNAEVPYEQ